MLRGFGFLPLLFTNFPEPVVALGIDVAVGQSAGSQGNDFFLLPARVFEIARFNKGCAHGVGEQKMFFGIRIQ